MGDEMKGLSIASLLILPALGFGGPDGHEWEDCSRLSLGKAAPVARFGSFPDVEGAKAILPWKSPRCVKLDSETEWRFNWARRPSERPVGFERPDYDVSGWPVVKVPCSWQAEGICRDRHRFGTPLYLNTEYTFTPRYPDNVGMWPKVMGADLPADWTFSGADNPVGSYRRDFEIPADWIGDEIRVVFGAVDSFFYLWINGEYVGFSKDSRSPAAFDITRFVKPGRNVIAAEVYRYSDGSYFECQDMWNLSGISRSVLLEHRPKMRVRDVRLTTVPTERGVYDGDWTLSLEVETTGPAEVGVEVFDASGAPVAFSGTPGAKCDLVFSKPLRWTAETPNLYTLVVTLAQGGRVTEACGFQLGFREVEIREAADPKDRVFLVNGQPVKLKGINRGETHPLYGHYVPDDITEEDIRLIKRGNFNHIRNSHYPEGDFFYHLCNVYGIYVMDEANIETHGYKYGKHSLSHPPELRAAHLDRTKAMVERMKNDPCVVIWSLGNESGPGLNMMACRDWIKSRDTTRPVQYERNNWFTDMGSRQYPTPLWVRKCAAGEMHLKYPYHINEYCHGLCNAGGWLADIQDAIESSTRICGGAVWDFADQGLYLTRPDGKRILAYSGDFGEAPNEGVGILDGWVSAERRPEPGWEEARHVFQPFTCRLTPDGKGVEIRCRHYFRGTEAYVCGWTLYENGERTASGEADLSGLGPQGTKTLSLPQEALDAAARSGVTAAIGYEFRQREEEGAWPKDWVIAADRLALSSSPVAYVPPETPPKFEETADEYVFTAGANRFVFSRRTGEFVSFRREDRELFLKPMSLDVFRAPTGIDMRTWAPDDGALNTTLGEGFREMLPQLVRMTVPVTDRGTMSFETESVYRGRRREHATGVIRSADQLKLEDLGPTVAENAHYVVRNCWRICGDGAVALESEFTQKGNPVEPTRLGWRFVLDRADAEVEWFGLGPHENYSDRAAGAFLGRWSLAASRFQFPYPRNQDSGNRGGTHAVSVKGAFDVAALGEPFAFMASPYSPSELILTPHYEDLPAPQKVELGVYARVAGIDRLGSQPDDTAERDIVRTDVPHRLSLLLGGGRLVRREWNNAGIVDAGWADCQSRNWCAKTSLVYECDPARVCPAANFNDGDGYFRFQEGVPGKDGFGFGMGDCALICGTALSGLVDRWRVTRDAGIAAQARKLARGVLNLAVLHGHPGFVARGVCAEDGRSVCSLSSRDQYTHWLHGLYRYVTSGLADDRFRAEFAMEVEHVAAYMERLCTPERNWNFGMLDGSPDPRGICTMWGPDLAPHEQARLPMIYAVAFSLTGNERWRTQYERFADEALRRSQGMSDPRETRRMPCYSLLQAMCSFELLHGIEKRPERLALLERAMSETAKVAASRAQAMLKDPSRRFYGLCPEGELSLTMEMWPSAVPMEVRAAFLDRVVRHAPLGASHVCCTAHVLAAFGRQACPGTGKAADIGKGTRDSQNAAYVDLGFLM